MSAASASGPSVLRRLSADLALLAIAALWGLTFPLGKIVLETLTPFAYMAVRFSFSSLVLLPFMLRRAAVLARRDRTASALLGVVLFLGFALQKIGLRITTASKAGFITGLSVVMVPVIWAVWMRRVPHQRVTTGIAAATVGLALLTLNGAIAVNVGDLFVLACAVCFAMHIVIMGRLAPRMDAITLTTVQVVVAAVLSVLAALTEGSLPAVATAGALIWGMILFMTVTGTLAALLVQSWAQRFTTPAHTGLMFAFEPVAAAIAAFHILGEVLVGRQAWGAALIFIGIVIAELNPGRAEIPVEARR
ncbi:MAG: DMT family transporter [bacterium]|nr:DMT family transporter [bacterium]